MVKFWIKYTDEEVGYRTLEGFITDLIDWVKSEHEDTQEQVYVYEQYDKENGFYITAQ